MESLKAHVEQLRGLLNMTNKLRAKLLHAQSLNDTDTLESVRSMLDTSFHVWALKKTLCASAAVKHAGVLDCNFSIR